VNRGDGIVVRACNPSDAPDDVAIRFGFDVAHATAVRLDETPATDLVTHDERTVALRVPPHALRTVVVQALRR
jgi:hypothetical protein